MKIKVYLVLIGLLALVSGNAQVKILFDCTKAETAGNADWVIDADQHNIYWESNDQIGSGTASNPQRYPTPLQNTVTSGTAETYWDGALSAWGIDCVKYGYEVETLPPTGLITYGDTTNPQDLSNYKVYIVDEPNILFNATEKAAMLNFVKNGGGLFMISDHAGSDRNNDGSDSPTVWNDFLSTYNNPFGFTWALNNFSGTMTNVPNLPGDSLLHGPYGAPTEIDYSNGTSLILNHTINPTSKGVMYENGCSNTGDTGVMFCYARYGYGKIVGTGDSSPEDDGTGNPACQLYNGWTSDAGGNHEKLVMNATIWLAETSVPGAVSLLVSTHDTTICKGASVTLTASGADTYSWLPGGATTAAITVQPVANTTYIVTGTTNGVSANDTITVDVDQFPSTTPQIDTTSGTASFCAGGSVVLTSPANSGYLWSNNATTQSITVTHAGTYYLTVTDNNGCTAQSDLVSVNVDNFPNLTPTITVTGATHVCTGGTVTLTAPQGYTYLWNNNSTLQTITVGQQGTYYAAMTDANGCHTHSDTVAVTVSPTLTGVLITATPSLAICAGSHIVLSAPPGYLCQWSTGASTDSITVSAIGNYYVIVSAGGGCNGVSDTVTTSIDSFGLHQEAVTVTGPTTFCAGDSVVLTAPAAAAYLWSDSATQKSIAVYQSGNYAVTVSDVNTCTVATSATAVTVNPLPNVSLVLSPDTLCLNAGILNLTTGSPAGGTYTGNGVTGTQFNPATAGAGNSAVTYTYTDSNNCINAATQNLNVQTCTGVNDISEQKISIYPNPSTGQFTIQLPGGQNNYPVEIYNVIGQKVEQGVLTNAQNTLNLNNQAAGMYFINVQMDDGVATAKVLVTK